MKRGISSVGLLTIVCLSSVGCSAVCIQNHLDEKLRCDIPNVEGRWSGTDRETGKQSYFDVVRDGVGRYRVIFPETGDFVVATTGERTSLRFEGVRRRGPAVRRAGSDNHSERTSAPASSASQS
jgi:hypothetical protein